MKNVVRPPRRKPMKLAGKLLKIREALGLSQNQILDELAFDESVKQQHISAWEKGIREPDLFSLMIYADAANVCLEILVSDNYDLPKEIPPKKLYHPHK